MSSQQGSVVPGDYSIATINTVLPPAANKRFVAWTTDSTPPGYAVCDGVTWTPPSTPVAYAFSAGAPVTRSLSLATAYQASTPVKPALITVLIDTVIALSLSPAANTIELIIGPTNAVAGGTGTLADSVRTDISVTIISIGLTSRQKLQAMLPAGYYFAVRRTVGTGTSISSAFDQTMG